VAGPGNSAGGAFAIPPLAAPLVGSRIAIVGTGLIGTSIALAIRRLNRDATLIGIDRPEVLQHPRLVETFTTLASTIEAAAPADIIVLAAPVQAIIEILQQPVVRSPRTLVMDTGSTKRAIVQAARAAGMTNFVGGHPMAGSERSGPDAARPELFEARHWFLVGGAPALARAGALVQAFGALPVFMTDDGERHDTLMAAVSHAPQVVVSALMARVGETVGHDGLAYAGAGLRDSTRLAASEARVWESILATNAEALRPLLLQLAEDLQRIATQLDDPAATRRLFGLANLYRRSLTGQTP
jgi:prephenate dehydrogenase